MAVLSWHFWLLVRKKIIRFRPFLFYKNFTHPLDKSFVWIKLKQYWSIVYNDFSFVSLFFLFFFFSKGLLNRIDTRYTNIDFMACYLFVSFSRDDGWLSKLLERIKRCNLIENFGRCENYIWIFCSLERTVYSSN